MENLDVMVLRTLRDWRAAGQRALLATVVRTWGSSPRPVGSIMALAEDGAVVGSVSGGCIEDDLIARYSRAHGAAGAAMPAGAPAFVKYGVTADDAHRFGLPCGGTLELLLEFDPDAGSLAALVAALEQGRLMQRTVRLADGAARIAEAASPAELTLNDSELVNTFGPEYRMLLIGAGQLAEYLATMAQFSGFAVTLCDPRAEYRSAWSLPGVDADHRDARRRGARLQARPPQLRGRAHARPEARRPGAARSARDRGFLRRRDRLAPQRTGAARAHDRALRPDRSLARAAARPDRHLHRQQDAARDRGERDGRDPGGEERGHAAARDGSSGGQGGGDA